MSVIWEDRRLGESDQQALEDFTDMWALRVGAPVRVRSVSMLICGLMPYAAVLAVGLLVGMAVRG